MSNVRYIKGLDSRIFDYKKNAPPLFLDGRFFNLVLGKSDEVSTKPIIVKLKASGTTTNLESIYVDITRPIVIFRVIVELYEQVTIRGVLKDTIYTRHSNLLIIDNVNRTITRFEPLQANDYTGNINSALIEHFKYQLPQHTYGEYDIHPQKLGNVGLCVAYVIKFAYFYIINQPIIFDDESDIIRFSLYINKLYSKQLRGQPDIEYGGMNPVLGGAAVGGLTGGLVGGLVAGPVGAVVGLGVGALGGAAIAGASSGHHHHDRRRY